MIIIQKSVWCFCTQRNRINNSIANVSQIKKELKEETDGEETIPLQNKACDDSSTISYRVRMDSLSLSVSGKKWAWRNVVDRDSIPHLCQNHGTRCVLNVSCWGYFFGSFGFDIKFLKNIYVCYDKCHEMIHLRNRMMFHGHDHLIGNPKERTKLKWGSLPIQFTHRNPSQDYDKAMPNAYGGFLEEASRQKVCYS